MKKFLILSLLAVVVFSACKKKQEIPAYLNPELPIDTRVDDLVRRMTLEQKVAQLNYESPAIDSLHIQKYNWWNECLHGVARAGKATVFPQTIGLAATWDKELIHEMAIAISDEARAKYHDFQKKNKRNIYQGLTYWTPNINIFRDPRWGRGMETYGEDPYLTGSMGVSLITGLQGDDPKYLKLVATAKHFAVHSGPESSRHSFNAEVSDYDLRETYLPAFKMAVKEADVYSVMCAYNRFKGKPCCGSSPLLNDILRSEWLFTGYVVSDCWALVDFYGGHKVVPTKAQAAAMAFRNGTDLNCGSTSPALVKAVDSGYISEAEIDVPLKRLMKARFMLGMFDSQDKVPFSKIPYDVVDSKEHHELALKTALKSMVLLKNEKNLLPLSKDIKKLAIIGPNANDVEVLLANYNGIPTDPITPLRGIREKLPNTSVLYALGCQHADKLPTLTAIPASAFYTNAEKNEKGLMAEYFDNSILKGLAKHTRVDSTVDFYWWDNAPYEDMYDDSFSVRWTGVIAPPVTGNYAIGTLGKLKYSLYINDSLILKFKNEHSSSKEYEFVKMEAGKTYNVRLEYADKDGGEAEMRLLWELPGSNYEKEAMDIAKKSDVIIMCMGLSPRLEGEEMKVRVDGFDGGDRVSIGLPTIQSNLIKKIYALGKPVVLVLINGSAVAINWESQNIPAILEAWYPGQAGGTAIADVLFGDYNPAGRLPVTFYKSVNDLPDFSDYSMKNRTYRYFTGEALYAFGYGLSYTTFNYSDFKAEKSVIGASDSVKVSFTLSNTGKFDGEEVIQLYVRNPISNQPQAIKSLKYYDRLLLKAGEKKSINMALAAESLATWSDAKGGFFVESGKYEILIGSSSVEKDLTNVAIEVK